MTNTCLQRMNAWARRLLPLLALLLLAAVGHAQGPQITKVDPPNWWVGHTINPVRLLLYGTNLAGAQVSASGGGVQASGVKVSASGTHIFCDLAINPHAVPGARTLTITTPQGKTTVAFDVLPPLPPAGRFAGFSPDDVIYLIMPDRFSNGDTSNDDPFASRGLYDRTNPHRYHGGDLQGIINHLDYLKDLGITTIWITPVYQNVQHLNSVQADSGNPISDYHGYGAVDFYNVEAHFGTLAKLRELVDKAHALGLKVIQDEVANHTSPYHPWLADPPTPTWYNGTQANHLNNPFDIHTLTDPHATPAIQKPSLDGWFVNILPDLNQDDPEVSRYEIQNTLWWLGSAGFDGIRQDTMSYVPRTFLRDWSGAIRRQYPRVSEVGEVYNGDVTIPSFFQGGQKRYDGVDTGVQSVFDFPLFYPLRRVFAQGHSIKDVTYLLGRDWVYPNANNLVTFLGLHDMKRFMSEDGATVLGLELAQTFIMTTRGIPMLYYGDELAMPGGDDPDNRRDFPGGWAGDERSAFTAAGRTPTEQEVWSHFRTLAHLHAQLPALRRGTLTHLYIADQQYAYTRQVNGDSVVVALNNDTNPIMFTVPLAPTVAWADGTALSDRLGGVTGTVVKDGHITLTLPARGAAIFTR